MRARELIGRRIVSVQFNRFMARTHGSERATQPVIVLDNGRQLRFVVQETDFGEYGVELCLSSKPAIGRSTP